MPAGIKCCAIPDHNIHGSRNTAQGTISLLRKTVAGLGGVIDQNQQVIVAVWPGIPSRPRPKEVNARRLKHRHQPLNDLPQHRVLVEQGIITHHGCTSAGSPVMVYAPGHTSITGLNKIAR